MLFSVNQRLWGGTKYDLPQKRLQGSYFAEKLNKNLVSSVTHATPCQVLAVHKHYTHYRVSLKLLYEVRKRTV